MSRVNVFANMVGSIEGSGGKKPTTGVTPVPPGEKSGDRRSRREEEAGLPISKTETKYDLETGIPLNPAPEISPEAQTALEGAKKKIDQAYDTTNPDT